MEASIELNKGERVIWFAEIGIIGGGINPIKAGGSESMYSLGGYFAPPSSRKNALENRYRVEMHVHSPIFQG